MIDLKGKKMTGEEFANEINSKAIDKRDGVTKIEGALLYPYIDGKSIRDLCENGEASTMTTAGLVLSDGSLPWFQILLMSFYGWRCKESESHVLRNDYLDIFYKCPHNVGIYLHDFARVIGINEKIHPFNKLNGCNTFADIFSSKEALSEVCECFLMWDMFLYMCYEDFKSALYNYPDIKLYIVKDGYCFPMEDDITDFNDLTCYSGRYEAVFRGLIHGRHDSADGFDYSHISSFIIRGKRLFYDGKNYLSIKPDGIVNTMYYQISARTNRYPLLRYQYCDSNDDDGNFEAAWRAYSLGRKTCYCDLHAGCLGRNLASFNYTSDIWANYGSYSTDITETPISFPVCRAISNGIIYYLGEIGLYVDGAPSFDGYRPIIHELYFYS